MGDLETNPQRESDKLLYVKDPFKVADSPDKSRISNLLLSKKARQTIAACVIGVMLAGGSVYYYNERNTGYAVNYAGNFLGYVRDQQTAIAALSTVKYDINQYDPSISVSDNLTFQKQLVNSEKLISSDYIKNTIESGLLMEYTCYSISLNGSEIAIVKNGIEAQKVIDGVKKYYEEQETQTGAEIVNLTIKDEIKSSPKIANVTKISEAQDIINMLTAGKGVTKDYSVQSGDTIWKIAKDNSMTINDIAAINPDLNVDKLQIGQIVKLSVSEPYLNVEAVENIALDENIPYNTTYVSSGDLYRGETSVIKKGEYGIKRITEQITKVNGVKVASTTLSTDVVKDPVTRVLARGTKALVGSGRFMWPVNGSISSLFGARGWEYHKGLDIAAPRGTPIYAADGGTVIISRRYYDYGLLVAIDHGNGYVTYYGHCSVLIANEGETVQKSQLIARVGSTGDSTGNHLHFEVRKNGVPQNPLSYLK